MGSQQQGQGQLEACYAVGNLQQWTATMQGHNSRARANLRHVMGVGWQPTQQAGPGSTWGMLCNSSMQGNNAGSQQQGQGQLEACYGCRLATYSSERQQCRVTTAGPGPTWGSYGCRLEPAVPMQGHNRGSQQGQGQLEACYGCRLATYSSERQQCRVTTAGPGSIWGMLWV